MFECSFELNNQPMSAFKIGAMSFPAFSGLGSSANQRALVCNKGTGAIPPGTYYIFDRETGGTLGAIRNLFSDRREWFALYAADGKIDDETFCNEVARGNFRLHPKGPLGRSEGCITLNELTHFQQLRAILRSVAPEAVPGTQLKAYGRVVVK
ncbi:DUF2778 domain-containing protein [Eleftheria terrae]|uniref:DUF2778 domain-containing protein n=1 Tax=Eleftheria terrae TaxID=1597781 RepID=UPI00263A7E5A|nr:DUF2778 domain-containing protein [Eleftheria terrae]WKB52593.1 DUF2778 domain-containing protein [Eleftheria terrae]